MDAGLRSLHRAYQSDPTDLDKYQQLVRGLERAGREEDLLAIFRHQYQTVPENQENYHKLVDALAKVKQLDELGFRRDLSPSQGNREKTRVGKVIDSGILEHYRITYSIRSPRDEFSHASSRFIPSNGPFSGRLLSNRDPLHGPSGPCGLYLVIGSSRSKLLNTELLSAIAHCIVDRWGQEAPEIIKPMPEDVGSSNSAEIVLSIILHWYYDLKFTDQDGLLSYLMSLDYSGENYPEANEVFVQTFLDLKKRGYLDRFEPATQRLADFITENYQNYSNIHKKILKAVKKYHREPIKDLKSGKKAGINDSIVTLEIKLLLKNGQEIPITIRNRLRNIAHFIQNEIGNYQAHLTSIQIAGLTERQFSTLDRLMNEDPLRLRGWGFERRPNEEMRKLLIWIPPGRRSKMRNPDSLQRSSGHLCFNDGYEYFAEGPDGRRNFYRARIEAPIVEIAANLRIREPNELLAVEDYPEIKPEGLTWESIDYWEKPPIFYLGLKSDEEIEQKAQELLDTIDPRIIRTATIPNLESWAESEFLNDPAAIEYYPGYMPQDLKRLAEALG